MSGKTTNRKKKGKSPSELLKNETLKYYRAQNEEFNEKQKLKKIKEEEIEEQKARLKLALFVSLSISIGIVIWSAQYLPFLSLLIIFSLAFLTIYTIIDFLITKREDRYQFYIKFIFEALTILVLVGQLAVMVNQKDIMQGQKQIDELQARILNETTQPVLADIFISPTQGIYQSYRLDEIICPDEGRCFGRIAIGIVNLGQITVPQVLVGLDKTGEIEGLELNRNSPSSSWEKFQTVNLKSLEINTTYFRFNFRPNGDYIRDWNMNKNYTNIMNLTGKKNLQFEIRCSAFCANPVTYKNVTICVYINDSKIECGEEWRNN